MFVFASCKKENEAYFDEPNNTYPNINIDTTKHTYIYRDSLYFYEGLFKSKSDIQKFNIYLKENRKYRISSSQIFEDSSSIKLSLLADNNDTITVSEKLNRQNVLYFNSLKNQTLILQAQLQNEYNISLDYRLFFEELLYDSLSLKNKYFSYNGHFEENSNSCYFSPSNSYWHRWLKCNETISNTANITYTFLSSEENKTAEFGFVIAGSERLNKGTLFEFFRLVEHFHCGFKFFHIFVNIVKSKRFPLRSHTLF